MYCGRERAERDRLFLRDEITRERERWLQVRCRRTGGGGEGRSRRAGAIKDRRRFRRGGTDSLTAIKLSRTGVGSATMRDCEARGDVWSRALRGLCGTGGGSGTGLSRGYRFPVYSPGFRAPHPGRGLSRGYRFPVHSPGFRARHPGRGCRGSGHQEHGRKHRFQE